MTKIDWVKNPDGTQGSTLNSKTGCLNHTPEGLCLGGMFPCYAYKLANGRLESRYLDNENIAEYNLYGEDSKEDALRDPFYPRFWTERLEQIKHRKKPTGIFLDDMSDWMGDYWPKEWTEQELQMMRDCPQHRIYTLTKQPQNLIKFSPFPQNCWVGVTVTKPEFLLPALDALDSIQCSVRYLSIEPMLAAFDVPDLSLLLMGSVDQLILGSQTKPYKPPEISWVEEGVRACDKAGVKVFLKVNLKPLIESQGMLAGQWAAKEWVMCKYPVLRQEMPIPVD